MRWFEKIRDWGRRLMQNVPGAAREFRDIFQLGGVPAFQQFYFDGMFVWKMLVPPLAGWVD